VGFMDKIETKSQRIFEETVAEEFPNLMEEMNINIQEAQWTSSKMNSETHTKICN
jgi:hypothetical protein